MRNHHIAIVTFAVLLGGAGCQRVTKDKAAPAEGSGGSGTTAGVATGSGAGSSTAPAPVQDIDSKDILARTEVAPGEVQVKHVLVAWKDLATAYGGRIDPRAAKRTNAEAAKLAQDIAAKLKANPDAIDGLCKENSEDPGSLSGDPYQVKADSPFVPEFKNLALRLKEKEIGIVKTQFGYHVMERVPPPPPDPLESADILARPAEPGPVKVQHVLIGWKDAPATRQGRGGDPRAKERTKDEADKLAKEVLDKVRAKGDMAKLMKEYSEDPGSKDNAKPYEVSQNVPFVEPFKNLSLRLKLDEAGLVKSPFGWHVIKRIVPPPPDKLESADILKREPVATSVKVKHILLSWKDGNPKDDRAQKRDRAALDKLVKATVAKLKAGAKIEGLMAELSEDPGSAKAGTSYDVTPDAAFVEPFKTLSLRLKPKEVGVVQTDFGFHIIQRVE